MSTEPIIVKTKHTELPPRGYAAIRLLKIIPSKEEKLHIVPENITLLLPNHIIVKLDGISKRRAPQDNPIKAKPTVFITLLLLNRYKRIP